jgi:hypothetical protein
MENEIYHKINFLVSRLEALDKKIKDVWLQNGGNKRRKEKCHNEKFNNFSSPYINWAMKSRRMRVTRRVVRKTEVRNSEMQSFGL